MKTYNSIRNSTVALIGNLFTIIIGIFAQAIFIKILGAEYLGLNGLFSNIISMLGIVELGIGSAIIYNLYKPLSENNISQIKSLLNFYKNAYNIIAFVVFLIGLFIMPFLPFFIKDISLDINIYFVYILFIVDIVFSYFLSYKRSILYADQKNYIIIIVHMSYLVFLNVFQLIILYFTKNYYYYLIIKILMRLYENIILSLIANKLYPYVNEKRVSILPANIKKDIFSKVRALFYHKTATFLVLGTDNIIISKFIGLSTVGLYSNYYLIISAVHNLIGSVINSLTPSIGHLLVENNSRKSFDVFKKIRFANFWLASFSAICLYIIMEPFIKIWIGEKFLLSHITLLVLVINFYQQVMRLSYSVFKEAAGIYVEDKYVPIFESFLNIIFSIIFVLCYGLPGVFAGTLLSGMLLWIYSYPKFIYIGLFNRSFFDYIKETFSYIFLFLTLLFFTDFVNSLIVFDDYFLSFISSVIISVFVSNTLLLIIFYKSDSFKYYFNLLKKIVKKVINHFNIFFFR